jgi:hypothetical protein
MRAWVTLTFVWVQHSGKAVVEVGDVVIDASDIEGALPYVGEPAATEVKTRNGSFIVKELPAEVRKRIEHAEYTLAKAEGELEVRFRQMLERAT